MKELTLEELRACEVDCLKVIHRFCEEHGLKYYLAFGSLIGAVRHKGFIPWDDDMDILMPRRDYNYLLEHFSAEPYQLIAYENEPRCYTAFAKVIDTRTVLKEDYTDFAIGAFVDIFPLENLPNGTLRRFLFGNLVRGQRFLTSVAAKDLNRKRAFYKTLLIRLAKLLFWGKDLNQLRYGWKYTQKYLAQEGTRYYGLMHHYFPGVPVLDADWFAAQIPLEFEGEQFYAPCGYDAFLRYCYGDYLTLPPVEEQKTHHHFTCWWKEGPSGTGASSPSAPEKT